MRVNTPTVVNPRVRVIPAKVETGRDDANPDGEKKKIAVYARVSTMEEEQQSSQELQESYFKEMIAKNENWELYKIYADHGVTGTNTKNRTAFNEMIEDAKEQQFDIIITKSISRFARNTLDCLTYVRMLKGLKKPVGVIFDRERISSLDSSSEMLLTIIASISEEESKTISANVCWGVTKRFSQGIPHIPTTYFLGYDEDEEGNLIINEEEAKTVRRIYKELLAGKGTVVIAKELTRDKVKTARGNTKWTSDSVLKLLRNEKYAGHALCQKSVTLDPLTHKRVRNKKHKPQYFIRNHHPPIISEEDWNEAQKELDRRSKMLHDPGGKYRRAYSGRAPFSNMFFCGTCGMPIIRRRITSNNKEKKYHFTTWHCRVASHKYKADFTCSAKYIWEEVIERAYNEMLLKMSKEIDQIRAEGEEAIEDVDLSADETRRLKELDEIIKRISNRISELSMKESTTYDQIYDATLRNLIYESQIYQQEYEALLKSQEESNYMRKNLETLIKHLQTIEDYETFNANIFKEIVESGIFHEDYEIEFIFKCGIRRKAYGWRRGKNPVEPIESDIEQETGYKNSL
ncbi:MAG: recombinase family protein [Syntrophomonadaceae bacterium]|jgi:site-specific DNA recombinase